MKTSLLLISLMVSSVTFGLARTNIDLRTGNIAQSYKQYAALDQALTRDDASLARKAAGDLLIVLTDVPDAGLAVKAASRISQTTNIGEQRKSFAALSLAMHQIFLKEKRGVMLYIHYCPMAKAYWMDASRTIHNPYLGKSMPTCGKTTGMLM